MKSNTKGIILIIALCITFDRSTYLLDGLFYAAALTHKFTPDTEISSSRINPKSRARNSSALMFARERSRLPSPLHRIEFNASLSGV